MKNTFRSNPLREIHTVINVRMGSSNKQELRRKIHSTDVSVWVGKKGIHSVVDELRKQLEGSEVVKVRFLRSAGTDVDVLADDLALEAGVELVDVRGRTAVYC